MLRHGCCRNRCACEDHANPGESAASWLVDSKVQQRLELRTGTANIYSPNITDVTLVPSNIVPMNPPVSVPEKTLEHWSSQYLTYRYQSKAALWWPVAGEDIDVQNLPYLPGKAVHLELKTTTLTASGQHDVMVDIGQLNDYLRSSTPVFYVFPLPGWQGELRLAARAANVIVTDVAYSRSGSPWWFAEWMVVMTAKEVAIVLAPEIQAHPGIGRGVRKRLVRINAHPRRTVVTWTNGATPRTYNWRDFWSILERCGETDWPQMVRLPASKTRSGAPLSKTKVLQMLRDSAASIKMGEVYPDKLRDFVSTNDGEFILRTRDDEFSYSDSDGDFNRQVTFLDARAMQQ